ncbi:hypothetical protein [uncultured Roseobacter sp.]|uniref:hypothetical protein n=1 Tax=uncultured Roseobacter sp. TaxID=114847 RepID=UPI0026357C4C|nr:hypothetical protein [uncultured Roseobacter sp.]
MTGRALIAAVFLLSTAGASGAGEKVYSGSEAAALRCANTLAFTAMALSDTGRMPEAEKQVMLGITVLILERHVSGTWAQKKSALAQVRDRRDVEQTLQDFERYAERCLLQFPIN